MSTPRILNVVCCVSTSVRSSGRIRRATCWLPGFVALLSMLMAAIASDALASTSMSAPAPTLRQVQQTMAALATPFEANQGQFAPEVAFAARTFAGTLFVTRDGTVVHALAGKPQQRQAKVTTEREEVHNGVEVTVANSMPHDRTRKSQVRRGPGWTLVETLQGARKLVPAGSQPSATRVNRFIGSDASQWHADIATFDRVRLGEAWPGVSVELAARGNNVEKLFTVAPGTSPSMIRMAVTGAKRLRLGGDGSLIAVTGNGEVVFTPPVAFQFIAGTRTEVPVKYLLPEDGSGYRFELMGGYDHSQPLVIDPLLRSTYLGGSGTNGIGNDIAKAVAVDASGNVFVAGYSTSTSFPGAAGGPPAANVPSDEAFVARLGNDLSTLSSLTFLGGRSDDQAATLTLDAAGNVFIAGATQSSDLPGTSGAAQVTLAGSGNAFVARLSNNLSLLVRTTYLGGNGTGGDGATDLAIDASGNLFVTGSTTSTNFPGTFGAAQSAIAGVTDAFVARLSSDLTTLVRATYLGGNRDDQALGVALDAGGNLFVAGYTLSTNLTGTAGAAQASSGGGADAFVARLSNDLTTLVRTTYLGGIGSDVALAVLTNSSGNVYVTGWTTSAIFPGTTGSAQATNAGSDDTFVARLSNDLTTLIRATYLGGSGGDEPLGMVLDASGSVFVAGVTGSTNLPGTLGSAQAANGGSYDAFVAHLSNDLTTLVRASYLGGSSEDRASALALDNSGNLFVAGFTKSTNFPATAGAAQSTHAGGNNDAFVAKLSPDLQSSTDPIFANGFD